MESKEKEIASSLSPDRGSDADEPAEGRVRVDWLLMSFAVAVAVGALTGLAILVAVRHLFDVLGDGGLPSQDHSFQWAAALGGLAAAIAVAAVLIAIATFHHADSNRTA